MPSETAETWKGMAINTPKPCVYRVRGCFVCGGRGTVERTRLFVLVKDAPEPREREVTEDCPSCKGTGKVALPVWAKLGVFDENSNE